MKAAVLAQVRPLAGPLGTQQEALLEILCQAAIADVACGLREDVAMEDCREAVILGASLMALAALEESAGTAGIQEFRAGDLTVKQGGAGCSQRSQALRDQAERLLGPYRKEKLVFMGV